MSSLRINRTTYALTLLIALIIPNIFLVLRDLLRSSSGEGVWTQVADFFVILGAIYALIVMCRAAIRRSRDFNLNGFIGFLLVFFIPFMFIIIAFFPGSAGVNNFGPRPEKKVDLLPNVLW